MARFRPYPTLKAWRTARGLSQRKAAALFGISQTFYSRIERNTQVPHPKLAKRMTETGVSLESILGIAS